MNEFVSDYLKSIKSKGGIYDYKVDVHITTWEELYPLMPVRLAIMSALENNEILSHYRNELPDHAKIYPYIQKSFMIFVYPDGYQECLEETVDCDENEYVIIKRFKTFELKVPGNMVIDCYITPIKSVEMVTLMYGTI